MACNDPDESSSAFHSGLTRKLILSQGDKEQPKRISNEALLAAGEILRIFVQECRHRAGIEAEIEAECEQEAETKENVNAESGKVSIRADHITKVAAELLMDFS
jgi:hypothetical protein